MVLKQQPELEPGLDCLVCATFEKGERITCSRTARSLRRTKCCCLSTTSFSSCTTPLPVNF